jgi:hypothetical protein
MKPLLLILFLSLSLAGFGQDTLKYQSAGTWKTLGSDATLSSLHGGTGGHISDPVYDTVAVWLTYADTTKSISYNMTVKGYEVTKTHYVPEVWKTEDHGNALVYYEAHWQTDHVAYLDHFKKPMNRLVWGTKRREK